MSRIPTKPLALEPPGVNDIERQDSQMQNFFTELLSEFRKVGEKLNSIYDRMGTVEANVSHIMSRSSSVEDYEAKVDNNDKRITLLEEAARNSISRQDRQSEWTRWGVGLMVFLVIAILGALAAFVLMHVHWF